MYICKHFDIEELVPPEVYEMASKEVNLWLIFDREALIILDNLRDTYGPLIVNDWKWGGERALSGFRPWETSTGSTFSQHKFGRAFDIIPQETSVETMRLDVLERQYTFMQRITGLELGISWFHFDVRNSDKLVSFRPN